MICGNYQFLKKYFHLPADILQKVVANCNTAVVYLNLATEAKIKTDEMHSFLETLNHSIAFTIENSTVSFDPKTCKQYNQHFMMSCSSNWWNFGFAFHYGNIICFKFTIYTNHCIVMMRQPKPHTQFVQRSNRN